MRQFRKIIGAALVLAGIAAQGTTTVDDIKYILRGYENMSGVLSSLGCEIIKEERVPSDGTRLLRQSVSRMPFRFSISLQTILSSIQITSSIHVSVMSLLRLRMLWVHLG